MWFGIRLDAVVLESTEPDPIHAAFTSQPKSQSKISIAQFQT